MTKRKIWGDREPIAGADLTDIGSYSESAVGDLALGFGPGILAGMHVQQTSTPSASVIVKAGKVLVTDPGVGRPRLLDLQVDTALSFASRSAGTYAVVVSATEVGEETRTILPPPVGHPFYEAGASSYQLATVQHWSASRRCRTAPPERRRSSPRSTGTARPSRRPTSPRSSAPRCPSSPPAACRPSLSPEQASPVILSA
jgi:hypothetical protein